MNRTQEWGALGALRIAALAGFFSYKGSSNPTYAAAATITAQFCTLLPEQHGDACRSKLGV